MNEVEVRGKLPGSDFERLKRLFSEKGKFVKDYKRLSVDLSPGFDPKTRSWPRGSKIDLRLKKSGKEEKVSVKVGDFHLKERPEIDLYLKGGQFLNAINLMVSLGFDEGMIYFWESWEFIFKGFEVKLSRYTHDYFTWEIESKDRKADPNDLARELGLVPYTKEEYRVAIDWENKNIHKLFKIEEIKSLLWT